MRGLSGCLAQQCWLSWVQEGGMAGVGRVEGQRAGGNGRLEGDCG